MSRICDRKKYFTTLHNEKKFEAGPAKKRV